MIANLVLDWTKSKAKVVSRLSAIRKKLKDCTPTTWPRPNINPVRWEKFLLDVQGCKSSIYMMKTGAYIPLSGKPFSHHPSTFPKLAR